MKTAYSIDGSGFAINGKLTYSEIPGGNPDVHGLLFNARFIQGIFDDAADPGRFARYGYAEWDPAANTERLVKALPSWYAAGLRAFTVGLQGGGPCFTIDNATIDNNPFGEDGTSLDRKYAERLDTLIRGADEAGMLVIVSYFYGAQAARLRDGRAIRNAVTTASRFLREGGYTNVIIEVANEQDIPPFKRHPIIWEPEGMAMLIDLAREESGGMAVGCSGGGGSVSREIIEASDVALIHGNGCSRQRYYEVVRKAQSFANGKPVVCNEDSQAIGQLDVAVRTGTSWGYYNNMTKQEPPAHWGILPGEDTFFALRMAEHIGIPSEMPDGDDAYYLQGFESEMTYGGERWIRLASLRPESIDRVDFYRNGSLYYTSYDESFSVHFKGNWLQGGVRIDPAGEGWRAVVTLGDGTVIEKTAHADGGTK